MGTLIQDVRLALRTLRRSPVFACVAILSLALGIGANTAIFTLMDQVLLRMLPVQHPEQLVMLDQQGPTQGKVENDNSFSYPMYKDFRDRSPVFSGVLARFPLGMSVSYRGQTELASGDLVSGNYFEVLGVRAWAGRTFTQDDDRTPGAHPVAFLTHGYWQRRFGGDRAILNQTLVINGHALTVVGIGPPGFSGTEIGRSADVMVPVMMKAQMTPTWNDLDNRRSWWLNVFARLKPGVTLTQADAAMNVLYRQIEAEEVKGIQGWDQKLRDRFINKHLDILPGGKGQSELRRGSSAPLKVLMWMVGLVLLIACANVANLLIARAAGRQKEIALRLALGARRSQIVRQLLVESLLLAVLGGAAGLLAASWAGDALMKMAPSEAVARSFSITPDLRILGFNFAVAIAAGLLFGMAPALRTTRPNIATTLKDQVGNIAGGASQARFRKTLVVAQMALSLLLLVGAGLFAHSLYNLKNIDLGFRAEHLMTFSIDPSLNGYSQSRIQELYARLQRDIGALPGVRGVSMADIGPLTDNVNQRTVTIEDYHLKPDEDMNPHVNDVGPGYFATLGTPLVAGREFTSRDAGGAPLVGMLNETAARAFFGNQNPLGRHFGFGGRRGIADIEIVGVVKDDKSAGLKQAAPRFVYVPFMQNETVTAITVYVRTTHDAAEVAAPLRRAVQQADAGLPVIGMRTMQAQVDRFLVTERLVAMLSGVFGLLATVLAAIGLYGVMAYAVARRTQEIGIRMALGADRAKVVRLVMSEVAAMAGIGIVIGLPCAMGLSRFVQSELFGVTPADAMTLGLASLALAVVSILAGYVPAWRATRVDPVVALRYE
jgi:predicted permease